jgi:AraC-like DNA-binding protein
MRHADEIIHAGLKDQPPGYAYATREYDQYQVIVVTGGDLHFETPDLRRALGAGDMAVLRVGSCFRLSTASTGYRGVCCIIGADAGAVFCGAATACAAGPAVCELVSLMRRELAQPMDGTQEVVRGLGLALAWQALRQIAVEPQSPDETARYWAERVRQTILATLRTGRGVREALAPLPLSYRQLARHFAACTGVSPKQFQQQARIAEVRRMLTDTRLSVTSIAAELGYPSSQHLSGLFRRMVGVTPAEYRRARGAYP